MQINPSIQNESQSSIGIIKDAIQTSDTTKTNATSPAVPENESKEKSNNNPPPQENNPANSSGGDNSKADKPNQ